MSKTTWRELILEEMDNRQDSIENIAGSASLDWDTGFYNGFGLSVGKPFTLWTKDYVYFPAVYDGAEWVASVPRNPCDEVTDHIGGQ